MALDPASRIRGLINRAEPSLRRAFEDIIKQLKSETTLAALATLLEQGLVDEALQQAARAGARFSAFVNGVYVAAGADTADFVGKSLEAIVDFDQTNVRAVSRMQLNRLRFIRGFNEEQRRATQEALVDGIQRGVNPRQAAREFRDSIGITQKQQRAVNSYRRLLTSNSREALNRQLRDRRFDRTIIRAIETDTPLTGTQINRMVSRYSERSLKHRSEVIARTEALRSVHEGSSEMYRQAIDEGVIDQATLIRTWNTAADERVRDSHDVIDGEEVGIEEPFVTGNGNELLWPGDINAPPEETIQCRCAVSTRFNRA